MRLAFGHRHTRDDKVYVAVAGRGRAIIEGTFRTDNEGDEGEFADAGWPA
jgi:hypothetical protein